MKDYQGDVGYFDLLYRPWYCGKVGLLVIFVSLSREMYETDVSCQTPELYYC